MIVWLLAVLGCHRATRALTWDDITEPLIHGKGSKLERWAYRERDPEPKREWRPWLHKLATCPHCLGWWLSWLTTGFVWLYLSKQKRRPRWLLFPLYGWAVAGGQSLLASAQAKLELSKEVDAEQVKDDG